MDDGIAPELARLFLPAYGMYVRWRWTTSLQGVMTFLDQRLGHDAQVEIQDYAKAVEALTNEAFPSTMGVVKNLKESND
jgi:thymidylate synthase (FAD)